MTAAPLLAAQWEARRIPHSHDHPPIRNANVIQEQEVGFGGRLADRFTQNR